MPGFVRVGSVGDVPRQRGRVFEVHGVKVAVFRSGPRFVAVSDRCPHQGASLSQGRLTGGRVECDWHGWTFDAGTGVSNRRSEATITVYRVRVEGDDLFLAPPDDVRPADRGEGSQDENDEAWASWDVDRYFKDRPEE